MPNLRKEHGVVLLRDVNFMYDFYRAREAWMQKKQPGVTRVRVHPMDTRKFHDEMERRKNERTELLRLEQANGAGLKNAEPTERKQQ